MESFLFKIHISAFFAAGLFSKAIMQSGTFSSNWAVWPEPAKQAKRFAGKFNCSLETSKEMIECLKNVDTRTFVEGHKEILVCI